VASASNVPGAREDAGSWVDEAGNFWIFGGYGLDSTGSLGNLNDLWEFNPASRTWTWVTGSNTTNVFGTYGTAGTSSTGNVPGARSLSVTWADHDGNFWLFGGYGAGASDFGNLDDMWKFSSTSLTWTWMGGSSAVNVNGNWGTKGV